MYVLGYHLHRVKFTEVYIIIIEEFPDIYFIICLWKCNLNKMKFFLSVQVANLDRGTHLCGLHSSRSLVQSQDAGESSQVCSPSLLTCSAVHLLCFDPAH